MLKKNFVSGAELMAQGIGPDDLARGTRKGLVAGPVTADGRPKTMDMHPCLYCSQHPTDLQKMHCTYAHRRECPADFRLMLSEALYPSIALEQVKTILGRDQGAPGRDLEPGPRAYADHMLDQGFAPDLVMLKLYDTFKDSHDMPQWKAAALALGRSFADLSEEDRDNLKSTFKRAKRKHSQK